MLAGTFHVGEYIEKSQSGLLTVEDLRHYGAASDILVPVLDEKGQLAHRRAIYLDNAATLPILAPVAHYANILEQKFRSNVGRSYGYRERLMRLAMGHTRLEALKFFRAPKAHLAILGTNVTALFLGLIKHIHHKFPSGHFLLSPMSHSATSIPIHNLSKDKWSYLAVTSCLNYDLELLKKQITDVKATGRDLTIAIETISNVTGHETNWQAVLNLASEHGARVILDNAQGACFVEIQLDRYPCDVYVGVSGHKMGARDGSAALVGPRNVFDVERPLDPTGGMIFHYTEDEEFYMPAPATLEAGTPNFISQASLAESFRLLGRVGLGKIRESLADIGGYLESRLRSVKNVKVLGCDEHEHRRYGPVSFTAFTPSGKEIPPMAIAASLSYFHGIQVRANHHCAPVLVHKLKGISNADANAISHLAMETLGKDFDTSSHPLTRHMELPADPLSALHTVRPSVSFGTTRAMVDHFITGLETVLEKGHYKDLKFVHNKAFDFNEYVPSKGNPEAIKALLFPKVTLESLV